MAFVKFLCLLLALTLPAQLLCESEKAEENFSVDLTADTFDEAIQGNNHFVMFFAPWCGHCKRLHPLWEQLAELMNVNEEPKVIIAKVDCTQHQELCGQQQVTGYPTLLFFKQGEKESIKFKGTRDMPAITDFINQQLHEDQELEMAVKENKDRSVELTEETFAKHIASGNHFVKFYAPWCSHCQSLAPTWETLSITLQNVKGVSIAKIDCTVYRPVCQDFDVKGYPTLLWIEDGKKIEKYTGRRDHDDLKAYVEKMMGGSEKVEAPKVPAEKKPNEEDKLKVMQLTGADFDATVDSGVTFVKFYAPWCGHCQNLSPTWDQLAEKMHSADNGIKIAKVDCTAPDNKNLCVDQQVEGYPTLFAYKNGEKQSEYDGVRALDALQTYVTKLLGHDEL